MLHTSVRLTSLAQSVIEESSILPCIHLACGFAFVCSPSGGPWVPQPSRDAVDHVPPTPGPVQGSWRWLVPLPHPVRGAQAHLRPTGCLWRQAPGAAVVTELERARQVRQSSGSCRVHRRVWWRPPRAPVPLRVLCPHAFLPP